MKKLFALGLVTTFLASCGIGSTPTDFNSLYTANIKAGMKEMDRIYDKWLPDTEFSGRFNSAIAFNDMDQVQNMSVASDMELVANRHVAQLDFKNAAYTFSGKDGDATITGKMGAESLSMMMGNATALMKILNPSVSIEGLTGDEKDAMEKKIADAMEKFQSANGKWVNYFNYDNVEGSQEFNEMMKKMQEFYVSGEYEKYYTKYPVLKAKSEGVQNGTKYTFDVEFDTENFSKMMKEMMTEATGSGTMFNEVDINKIFDKNVFQDFSVTYDSKDPLYNDVKVTIVSDGIPYKLPMQWTWEKDRIFFKVVAQEKEDSKELGSFVFESKTSGKNTDFTAKVFADISGAGKQSEVFTSAGKIVDTTLQNFDATISAGVAEGTIKYVHKDIFEMKVFAMNNELANIYNKFTGDNFAGKMNIQGQEIATWNAEVAGKKLTALMLKISDMASGVASDKPLLEMNLGKQENSDMIGGTAKVALAGNDFASAKVQLEVVGSEKFGIIIEDIQAIGESFVTEMIPLKKFEFFAQGKSSKTNKKVSLPKETISVTEFQKVIEGFSFLDNIYPTQEYSADDMTDISADAVPMDVVTAE